MKQQDPYRRKIKKIHRPLLCVFDTAFSQFEHTREIKEYGHKRTFPNGMWFDLLCHQEKKPAVFRLSRGAWIVQQEPALGFLIQTSKVIGKIDIPSEDFFHEQKIQLLLEYIFRAPAGVGVYENT